MGQNTKALKARIRTVDSTMHITKAMELVASSKIRRARERMESGRFYRAVLRDAFADLAASDTPYSRPRDKSLPTLHIVIAGDRGLAGGYNNNVFKLTNRALRPGDRVIPIGRRAAEYFARRAAVDEADRHHSSEHLTTAACADIARRVKEAYDRGEIGRVRLVSTAFASMLTQTAEETILLPLAPAEAEKKAAGPRADVLYEPDAASVLAAIIPEYLAGVVYSAACESFAAEVAARRAAMDTASKNAASMIDQLNLQYNRARQSAITQEITEIVAGGAT